MFDGMITKAKRDELRRNAQRAQEADHGSWKVWVMDVYADPVGDSNIDTAVLVARTGYCDEQGRPGAHICDHIAAADPPTMLALLDALDEAEKRAEAAENPVYSMPEYVADCRPRRAQQPIEAPHRASCGYKKDGDVCDCWP
jgi:hypothetical protein